MHSPRRITAQRSASVYECGWIHLAAKPAIRKGETELPEKSPFRDFSGAARMSQQFPFWARDPKMSFVRSMRRQRPSRLFRHSLVTRSWHHHYRWCSMETKRAASTYPTVDEINAPPEKFRRYIHDLETHCDKSGHVQTIALLREDRDALAREVEELKATIALLTYSERVD